MSIETTSAGLLRTDPISAPPRSVTAGQAIVEILKAEGVRCVFGMPGGHVLGIYDALYDTPEIRHVLVRHEQTAACMAAAYAQLTGEPAVCLTTAGPGTTNLVTGIAEAFVGSLPVIILSGRGATATTYRGASQEIATDKLFAPITKWSVRVDRADLLAEVLHQAFITARNGKPGPVLIDIPRDILNEHIVAGDYIPAGPPTRPRGDSGRIRLAAEALVNAARPIVVAGGGAVASNASQAVRELAERLQIPVLTSLAGRGIIPDDHPLSVGGLGAHRNALSKRLLREADVVLGLGTRFEEMENNWRPGFVPVPSATYIQVDIDPVEIGRSIPAKIGIVGDVRFVVEEMLSAIPARHSDNPRVRRCGEELDEIKAALGEFAMSDRIPIHPLRVLRAVREAFPRDTTIGIDVGCLAQHMAGSFPAFPVFEPRSLIVPSSFYGMGFASAALPVAKIVYPDRPAVGFVGDGSFTMIMNVLPVAAEYKLGVTWCILNDGALGSIRDIQQYGMANRIIDTDLSPNPDFAMVAKGCGCYGERIEAPDRIVAAIERAREANRQGIPAVLDFSVGRDRLQGTYDHYLFYGGKAP